MRYASIRSFDVTNGEGIGISLFVQGCHFHCYNCFNSETWDFNGGKEWNENVENDFIDMADKPHITRISFLGGDPLAFENLKDILNLINHIRDKFGNSKKIWLYTGYTWEEIIKDVFLFEIICKVDVVVDGRYMHNLRDLTLAYRGSKNQRVIDVQKSLRENKMKECGCINND